MAPSISVTVHIVPYVQGDGESCVIDVASGDRFLRIWCRGDRPCGLVFPADGNFTEIGYQLEREFPGVNPDSLILRIRRNLDAFIDANP
jgi:hypothetical protein